ncbi:MAG: hypothetical protein PHF63_00510 [Herbinix sp.]|nr:hypothetical protein [Herbinix sp.]
MANNTITMKFNVKKGSNNINGIRYDEQSYEKALNDYKMKNSSYPYVYAYISTPNTIDIKLDPCSCIGKILEIDENRDEAVVEILDEKLYSQFKNMELTLGLFGYVNIPDNVDDPFTIVRIMGYYLLNKNNDPIKKS